TGVQTCALPISNFFHALVKAALAADLRPRCCSWRRRQGAGRAERNHCVPERKRPELAAPDRAPHICFSKFLENCMNNVRKPLTGLIALGVALAMPMAFAQEADSVDQPPQAQAAQQAQGQVSWADLDSDGDG